MSFKSLLQGKREEERGIGRRKNVILGCCKSSSDTTIFLLLLSFLFTPISFLSLFLIPRGSLTWTHVFSRELLIKFRDLNRGEKCTFIFANLWWNFSIFFNYKCRLQSLVLLALTLLPMGITFKNFNTDVAGILKYYLHTSPIENHSSGST